MGGGNAAKRSQAGRSPPALPSLANRSGPDRSGTGGGKGSACDSSGDLGGDPGRSSACAGGRGFSASPAGAGTDADRDASFGVSAFHSDPITAPPPSPSNTATPIASTATVQGCPTQAAKRRRKRLCRRVMSGPDDGLLSPRLPRSSLQPIWGCRQRKGHGRGKPPHPIRIPPARVRVSPVMVSDSDDARYTARCATSIG